MDRDRVKWTWFESIPCYSSLFWTYSDLLGMSIGGGGGIRTPGRLPVSGFQDHRLEPLGHPSVLAPEACGKAAAEALWTLPKAGRQVNARG